MIPKTTKRISFTAISTAISRSKRNCVIIGCYCFPIAVLDPTKCIPLVSMKVSHIRINLDSLLVGYQGFLVAFKLIEHFSLTIMSLGILRIELDGLLIGF